MKRTLAMLLAIVMVFCLLPVTALAEGDAIFKAVTTGNTTIYPGEDITVSIEIENNPNFGSLELLVNYGAGLTIKSMDYGAALSTNGEINPAFTANTAKIVDIGGRTGNSNNGALATIVFTANDGAFGDQQISLTVSEFQDMDEEDAGYTVQNLTVNVKAQQVALSFVDGANTYDYDTLKADNYTLTAPGAGYYFAGWFAGLTVDGTKIVDDNGRYVLKSAAVEDGDSFAATELRPKYEDAPETGEYHALWVHENDANPTVMVLEVAENSITYRKQTYSDTASEVTSSTAILTAAAKDLNGQDGQGRVKLVKDLKEEDCFYDADEWLYLPFCLDLNGCTLTETQASERSVHPVLLFRYDSTLDSSHGQGKLVQTSEDNFSGASVIAANQPITLDIRDVDLEANLTCNAYGLDIPYVSGLIENVNINVTGADGTAAIYGYDIAATLDYVNITTNGALLSNDVDSGGFTLGPVTNCTWTTSAEHDEDAVYNTEAITFGEGNVITTEGNVLFAGEGTLNFTADGTYSAKAGGTAYTSKVKFGQTPEGQPARDDNGTLRFGQEPVWGEPTYEWAADNSTVTATRAASNIEGKTETETVTATSVVTKEATLTEDGEIVYTATFENEAFETQTKTVVLPKISAFIVSFNANGGEGTMEPQSFAFDAEPAALTANAFTKDGMSFAGWCTAPNGNGETYSDGQSVSFQTTDGTEMTLYAQWSHEHSYDYDNPSWEWRVINGKWYASARFKCACGESVTENATVTTTENNETVTYTASCRGLESSRTENKTFTVTYNESTSTYTYAQPCTLTADQESDWYVNDVLRAKGATVFSFAVIDNVTVTSTPSQSAEQEPLATATMTSTEAKKAVFKAVWSMPDSFRVKSVTIYRGSSSKPTPVAENTLLTKGKKCIVNLLVSNGSYTLNITGLTTGKYQNAIIVIEYIDGNGQAGTLKSDVVNVQVK